MCKMDRGEKLVCKQRASPLLGSVTTWRGGLGERRGAQDGRDVCMTTDDSHSCAAETSAALQSDCPLKKKERKKDKFILRVSILKKI